MLSFLIHSHSLLLLLSLLLTTINPTFQSPSQDHHKHPHAWHKFGKLVDAKKGSQAEGIADLKHYFHRFGYYHHLLVKGVMKNFTNEFDEHLEYVLTRYQQNYGLPITGTLNPRTLSMIMSPRCGMPDQYSMTHEKPSSLHATQHFRYFPGQPRWDRRIPMTLSYAFSLENMVPYLSMREIRGAFKRAFFEWASVIPVNFIETDDYGLADIKIGFYSGDHGDGEPFDGVLGILAHAFSPDSGRFHLDAAETWAVDFKREESKVAVDLESVALHEIGHLLGLSHSNIKESVMYPSLKPREKKLNLKFDDIEGVQYLYGSNPNFTIGALLESETSSSSSIECRENWSRLASLLLISIMYFCL